MMSIKGIVGTVMIENIHPDKIEIIDNLIGVIDIMMREGSMTREEMKKISHIIVDFRMTSGMITKELRHPDNFSMIPRPEMS